MPEESWDDAIEYLSRSRFLGTNDDYFEFLVRNVWKLDKPCRIADFGCGLGFMGMKLLPLLPEGSAYTGIDKSEPLLKEAEQVFTGCPFPYRFIQAEVYSVPQEDSSFDVAVSHSVLMHVERATDMLDEMIRVTRSGGMVITADANRDAHNALFYTNGTDTERSLIFSQRMNRDIREKSGVDYNIGIKTPVLMDKVGLKDIDCRISDRVTLLFPGMDPKERQRIHEVLCLEGVALPENFEEIEPQIRERLSGYGFSDEEIDAQFAYEKELDFRNRGQRYHTVYPGLSVWSWGTVEKEA